MQILPIHTVKIFCLFGFMLILYHIINTYVVHDPYEYHLNINHSFQKERERENKAVCKINGRDYSIMTRI